MIKTLSGEDAVALSAIHAAAFARPWSPASIRSLLTASNVIMIGDDPLCGFAIIRVVAQEAEILTLAVLPDCRRHGLGRRLAVSAEQAAAALGAEVMFLEVAEDNHAARSLYESQGFSPAARRRAYYQNPDGAAVDALVLRKSPLRPA